ncbi:MAG: DUF3467 domain-containing protein [Spirochaetes bacterium]|nr:DUF3467 domain-containing protein [Spirochaetota bacterium]MCK5268555.1 DUF3467 domain-containing protein [Spirochaetota bacterium]
MNKNQVKEIKIELDEKSAQGHYANLVIISHSDSEFILDFSKFLPGTPSAKVHSRVIMTPKHTKILLKSLEQNIGNFEKNFGEIKTAENETFPPQGVTIN